MMLSASSELESMELFKKQATNSYVFCCINKGSSIQICMWVYIYTYNIWQSMLKYFYYFENTLLDFFLLF